MSTSITFERENSVKNIRTVIGVNMYFNDHDFEVKEDFIDIPMEALLGLPSTDYDDYELFEKFYKELMKYEHAESTDDAKMRYKEIAYAPKNIVGEKIHIACARLIFYYPDDTSKYVHFINDGSCPDLFDCLMKLATSGTRKRKPKE